MRDGEQLTTEKIKAYVAVLSDIDPDALERGLQRCARECTFFPTATEIRERSENPTLAGEQQWNLVKYIFKHHWHPDLGIHSGPPQLDAGGEYALRQIGGFGGFSATDLAHEGFIRKNFLEAFQRFHAEGGEQTRFTQQLAENTLKQLQAAQSPVPALPPPQSNPGPRPITTRVTPRQMDPDEYETRMAELRRQAEQLKVKSEA